MPSLASELQTSAVTIFDTASNGRDGAASKMLLGRCPLPIVCSLKVDYRDSGPLQFLDGETSDASSTHNCYGR